MDIQQNGDDGAFGRGFAQLAFIRQSDEVRALSAADFPPLRNPILVTAYEGWSDAGEAASYAAGYLIRQWNAQPFVEIDPDEFFDFTEVRPEVSLGGGTTRHILWPSTRFSIVRSLGDGPDLVIVRGPEPHFRWRGYTEAMIELAQLLGIELVISLGAYLSEVTHGRPVPVNATSSDPHLAELHGLSPSLYEGPTGIVGVLSAAFAATGIPTMSVWASVPCYSLPTSPKAALALVRVAARLLERSVDEEEISAEAAEYEERMDELVAEDENVADYVARIEEMEEVVGSELSAEGLTEEIERFLRDGRYR